MYIDRLNGGVQQIARTYKFITIVTYIELESTMNTHIKEKEDALKRLTKLQQAQKVNKVNGK
jgi:hypothetical protein